MPLIVSQYRNPRHALSHPQSHPATHNLQQAEKLRLHQTRKCRKGKLRAPGCRLHKAVHLGGPNGEWTSAKC